MILESIIGIAKYVGVLGIAVLLSKYVFKVHPMILAPCMAVLCAYVLGVIAAPYTINKNQSVLFALWSVFVVSVFIFGVWIAFKNGTRLVPFLLSLLVQMPYSIVLYYYGGIIFTHKFD